jgi:plasmid stabilization system protein ParE
MKQVIWTPVAESDLDDILFYIAIVDRNPATGEKIYYEIRDRVFEHVQKSLPGHLHPDAPKGWLYLKHKRWLVFYQPLSDGIEVMRVIDAARDLPRRLRDGL